MAEKSIDITTMSFPANTPVAKGDTVVWTNKMRAAHTVPSDKQGEFDSGQLRQNGVFRHTFTEAGAFAYHCENHPDVMKGTVTVT